MTTMTLADFLLARIAEDEECARAAFHDERIARGGREPRKDDGRWLAGGYAEERVEGVGITIYDEGGHDAAQARHIARWDPARVLAECEAKRLAIDAAWGDHVRIEGEWGMCQSREQMDAKGDAPEVVAHLGAVFADHPDYRDEWRP